jgi:hypothetical protein
LFISEKLISKALEAEVLFNQAMIKVGVACHLEISIQIHCRWRKEYGVLDLIKRGKCD